MSRSHSELMHIPCPVVVRVGVSYITRKTPTIDLSEKMDLGGWDGGSGFVERRVGL